MIPDTGKTHAAKATKVSIGFNAFNVELAECGGAMEAKEPLPSIKGKSRINIPDSDCAPDSAFPNRALFECLHLPMEISLADIYGEQVLKRIFGLELFTC